MACLIRAVARAAAHASTCIFGVEACVFGEIVDLPPDAFSVVDTAWGPDPPPDGLATSRNFPAARICPGLRLVHPRTSALVREFWYRPDPDPDDAGPTYDGPPDEGEYLYARLLSKDSHYIDVGHTLLAVAVSFSSLLTQAQLALQCVFQSRSFQSVAAHPLRLWFAAIFLAKLVALLATSLARARRKLSKDPGDLRGADLGRGGRCSRMLVMMLFNIFDVPGAVSDILNLAHITKPFQPFAVFRTGGSRVWILGWRTRSHFHVDMEFSSMSNLVASIIFDVPLIYMQFFLAHGTTLSVSLFLTILTSLVKLVSSIYKAYNLRRHRKRYHKYQTEEARAWLGQLQELRARGADRATIDPLEGRVRAMYRDLTYHFGERYPHEDLPPRPADQPHEDLPLRPADQDGPLLHPAV